MAQGGGTAGSLAVGLSPVTAQSPLEEMQGWSEGDSG
jgi:hypothetical protein